MAISYINSAMPKSIQKFFLESLDKLSEIKSQHRDLTWDSSNADGGIMDDANPSTSIE